jgi:O-antigen ligase
MGLLRHAEWPLYLFAILAPLPTLWYPIHDLPLGKGSLDLLVASSFIGSVLRPGATDEPAVTAPLRWWVLCMVVLTYAALWNTALRFDLPKPLTRDNSVLADWKNYVLMLMLYLLAFRTIRTEQQARVLANCMVGVLLYMVWREMTGFVAGESFSYNRRADGPFWVMGLNSNHYAAFVSSTAALALGIAMTAGPGRRRWLHFGALAGALYPIFFAYSRGAYAAILVAVTCLAMLRSRLALVVLAIFVLSWQQVVPDTVVQRIQMTESADGELEESAAERLVVWERAKTIFSDHPVMGIGFNGFWFASQDLNLHNVHNYYLQMAAEMGTVGLVMLVALLVASARHGLRLYRRASSAFTSGLGLGLVGVTCSVAVANFFGDRFSYLEINSYLFLLLGAVDRCLALPAVASQIVPPAEEVPPTPARKNHASLSVRHGNG